jgi:thiamine kinase-like enzyme
VIDLLVHLESRGVEGVQRVEGSGFDESGNEALRYVEGELEHPGPMKRESAAAVASILRTLHEATTTYEPPPGAAWQSWFGRDLGKPSVIGHCDAAPWNVIVKQEGAVVLVDWECAGPVDPLVDLAHACWLCANLYSDDIAAMNDLPPLEVRAGTLKAMVDTYGLNGPGRGDLVRLMIDVAIYSVAADADEYAVTVDTQQSNALWGMAWRSRSAAWMLRHRSVLEDAVR